jgi:acetyl esterase
MSDDTPRIDTPAPGSPGALMLEVMENRDRSKPLVIVVTADGCEAPDDRAVVSRFTAAGLLVHDFVCRLSPTYTFAEARDDLFDRYVWLARSDYAFDRSRIVLFGVSMCGNLAVEAAIATGTPAVSWSGPLDLRDGDPNGSDDQAREEASPVYRVHPSCGPIYLANSLDEVVPAAQPLRMHAALVAAGVPTTLQLLRGVRHGYEYLDDAIGPTISFVQHATRVG